MKIQYKIIKAFVFSFIRAKYWQKQPHDKLQQYQRSQFDSFKKNILIKSPFYVTYLDKNLTEFPVIDKSTHMENFDSINTQQLSKDKALSIAIQSENSRDFKPVYNHFSVGLSSGTSGNRGLFVLSDIERAEWAGYIIGKMLPTQLKKQRIAFFLRANNNLYESVNGLFIQFKYFDLLKGVESNLSELEKFEPTILIAPSSVLSRIAFLQPDIHPEKVIAVAEVMEKDDEEKIQRCFNRTVEQVYQCTEGFLASTCRRGQLHLNEDVVIIEKQWIDQSTGRFSPIVTDFRRKTQPIVRYQLDDVLIEDKRPCQCGSSMTRLKKIEGRMDDVLQLKSNAGELVDVFPDFVRNKIIAASPQIKDYQVVQSSLCNFEVYINPCNEKTQKQIKSALTELWKTLNVGEPNYTFHQYHLFIKSSGDKRRRIKRLRSDSQTTLKGIS